MDKRVDIAESFFSLPTSAQHGGLNIHLSPNHVFVTAPDDTLVIHPTAKRLLSKNSGQVTLSQTIHSATTHDCGILCCCSDVHVILLHWDALLGDWERIIVSEGEGRVGSVVLVSDGNRLWVTIFKWNAIVIYLLKSVHNLNEPGPLLLESIQVVAMLEKSKDTTIHPHAFLGPSSDNCLFLLGVSTPLSIKMWEIQLNSGTGRLLKQQGFGMCIKSVEASDHVQLGQDQYLLVMSGEGAAEVFHIGNAGFSLLNRFRVIEEGVGESGATDEEQTEWRVLKAKFCSLGSGIIVGDSDDVEVEDKSHSDSSLLVPEKHSTFPKLLIIILTTRGFTLMNAKSGHVLQHLPYRHLMRVDLGMVGVEAEIAINPDETATLAIHFLFSTNVRLIRINIPSLLEASTISNNSSAESSCSLLTSDVLSVKSVLRKRFKSPSKLTVGGTNARRKPQSRNGFSRGGVKKPAWATKARSRASPPKKSPIYNKELPGTARAHTPKTIHYHQKGDDGVMTSRPVTLPRKGSYDDDNFAVSRPGIFGERLRLNSGLMSGHSNLRIAMTRDGSVLAAGGNLSPVAVMRTYPCWETLRLMKDLTKVTSLHFNFQSNLILVGSNDGRTRIISWRRGKELLSWDFISKFNEHIHAQFYFMDKFVLQPQLSSLVLYALREIPSLAGEGVDLQKLLAATFPLDAQSITAVAAPNQFLSSKILAGLSNKGLQIFDVNAERVSLSIPFAHSKPVTCIRLNEAPLDGAQTSYLSDIFLTSAPSHVDPIKLWDLRQGGYPVLRLSDINSAIFVPPARPALSPCGRFIATGCEDNSLVVYDTRRMQSRHSVFGPLKSTVLDCTFDPVVPSIWAGCRNGNFFKFS